MLLGQQQRASSLSDSAQHLPGKILLLESTTSSGLLFSYRTVLTISRQKLGYSFGAVLFSPPCFQRKFSWCDVGRELCAFLITCSPISLYNRYYLRAVFFCFNQPG